jgi:uncharacterized membrane protein
MKQIILDSSDIIMVYGLALIPLLSGVTKFVMPGLWQGYEPELVRMILAPETFMVISGVVETALGVALLTRKRTEVFASVTAVWLLAITVQVTRLGIYDIAIRDLGLTMYALSVALNALNR